MTEQEAISIVNIMDMAVAGEIIGLTVKLKITNAQRFKFLCLSK